MMRIKLSRSGFLAAALVFAALLSQASPIPENVTAASPRECILFDAGWKFYLGNPWGEVVHLDKAGGNSGPARPDFSDADWRTLDLPHDWAIELPFDSKADCNHGFKPVGPGFPQNNIGWYRRTFTLSKADASKRLRLQFDGVYRNCDVFVNGWLAGHHDSGYQSFSDDITALANCGGKNVVAVRVDASQFEGWFYEGAGIYRHVWLVKTSPLAIVPDGIFVHGAFKNNVPKGSAEVTVEASLLNLQTNAAATVVACEIFSPDGASVATFHAAKTINYSAPTTISLHGKVSEPVLWSPESPKLYKLVTTIESGGQVTDRQETEFGLRTMAFDPNLGFLLNGAHYEIQGTCNHQDAAGVGLALPDQLQYYRIAKLKEMGGNAYRTSHNAPTPELLEACDRLGMLVLDENRIFGSDAANLERLKAQIIRDRNHPSVFAWSLGNEEWNAQDTAIGAGVTKAMQDLAHSLDPTRLCTVAVNSGNYGDFGIFSALDVKGFNYHFESMDAYHAAFPKALILATEQASSIGTRGIYTNDAALGYISAYDDHNPRWGCSAEEWWSYFATRPWASGGFDWTGFDYRGEPTPYQWPCISSHFGILDTCGFPKDNFWYYQSWWTTNVVLHLLPHWNWPGREGQDIDVRALSNCQEVELFLNGQSLGRQAMKPNSELKWKVKYMPGALTAHGFNDGRLVAEAKVETTGEPAAIGLTADRSAIDADGEDISIITVAVVDAQNRTNPLASNLIHFALSGPGKILGVGNGNPTCHEPDTFVAPPKVVVKALNDGWHYKIMDNVQDAHLPELQPGFDDSGWDQVDAGANADSLKQPAQAAYRNHFVVDADDLSAETVQLKIGRIDDRGWVYVNGQLVGESHDWSASPSFDIKPWLHPGSNAIAVAVVNSDGAGGLGNTIFLRDYKMAVAPAWQRSAFNGLAQVIVQSTAAAGDLRLTASGDGLASGTITIHAHPAPSRKLPPPAPQDILAGFEPAPWTLPACPALKAGDRLAICGDSITEQRMYSRIMEDYLTVCVPQLKVEVRQYGWSGEQVPGFLGRMTNDCLRSNPTIATTCYGMNDFGYRPFEKRTGQIYEANSIRMVDAFKAHGVRVVLGSPGSISRIPPWVKSPTITVEDLNLSLGALRNIDVGVAEKENIRFADVFWPMFAGGLAGAQAYGTNYAIPGNDGVHPHWAGHTIMAYAYLKALGLNGNLGTFTVDLKHDTIKVTEGHTVISAQAGTYEITSSRYPFCPCGPDGQAAAGYPEAGQDDITSDNSIQSGMTLVPFNQDLNRLTLIVKNAPAGNYQVKWGAVSKTFTGTQLARGINVAAEFPINPFSEAFARVDAAVAAKQAFETKEIKERFHGAGSGTSAEEIARHTDAVVGAAEAEHEALVAAVIAAFVPVTHTLSITAE